MCEVLAVAAAQDAYNAAHGTYFATTPTGCASLPGYTPTPESHVSCNLWASSTSFTIAAINTNAPAYTCMYYSTATPALDCF